MDKKTKSGIAVVLVSPENPDNIGAVSRAMKNMGLDDLRLVNPPAAWKEKGRKMAVFAADLLEKAKVFRSLGEAVQDAALVIGTTRREGKRRGRFLPFHDAIRSVKMTAQKKQVALLFGKEAKGLSNRDIVACDWLVTIPANPAYPSLNLAQAVMVVAFSLTDPKNDPSKELKLNLISKRHTEDVLRRFAKAIKVLDYTPAIQKRVLATVRALLKRSGLLESEAQMLKGLSRRICERTVPREATRRA